MIKVLLYLFLIGHILGDYYFKSFEFSKGNNELFKNLVKDSIKYLFCLIGTLLPIINKSILIYIFVIAIVNFIINYYQYFLHFKIFKNVKEEYTYIFKQIIHIVVIFVVVDIITFQQSIEYISIINQYINKYSIDLLNLISWLLIILIIIKPISTTIKIFLDKYKPSMKSEISGVNNAGFLIGVMERIFILLMLFIKRYSTIGLVLTAKSIVRYNKIIEEPEFSEYYLLGTLMSTILVIITFFLVF